MTEERRKSLNAIAKRFNICPLTVYLLAGHGVSIDYRPTERDMRYRASYSYVPGDRMYSLV